MSLGEFPPGAFEQPTVSVWRPPDAGGSLWRRTGDVSLYETLSFSPAYQALGEWSLTMDYNDQADLLENNRLVTVDWRGVRTTWVLEPHPSSDEETGQPKLEGAGVGAVSMLGWEASWPDPTKPNTNAGVNDQPVVTADDPPLYKGPAEDVITRLVAGNLRDRRGMAITVPASQHRGTVVTASPTFDNLLELVTSLAKLGGIGVDVGLVDVGGPGTTTAALTLQMWEPADKTKSVLLTAEAGTIDSWDQVETAPTATMAIVAGGGTGGVDRIRQIVTTPESVAAATAWGGHRVVFVDGTSTFDPEVLEQDGKQALLDGAATRTLALTSSEVPGQLAFIDFDRGDKATGQVVTGASAQDVITSLQVTIDPDSESGFTVSATFGDPNATDEDLDLVTQLVAQKQAIRRLQRR